jgi:hypothetical protein
MIQEGAGGYCRRPRGQAEDGESVQLFQVISSRAVTTRKLCSLYLGIMDHMGVELPEPGHVKARLAGFSVTNS